MLGFPCESRLQCCRISKHTHVMSGPLGCSAGWGFVSIRPRSCKPWIVSANPDGRKFISCVDAPFNTGLNNFIHMSIKKIILFITYYSLKSDVFSMSTLHVHLTLKVCLHRTLHDNTEYVLYSYVQCRVQY
jgi:hypothetical protein